jgi:hypothetical protein
MRITPEDNTIHNKYKEQQLLWSDLVYATGGNTIQKDNNASELPHLSVYFEGRTECQNKSENNKITTGEVYITKCHDLQSYLELQ